jgi:Zn-dependent M28 family amino/carboxypeptidase
MAVGPFKQTSIPADIIICILADTQLNPMLRKILSITLPGLYSFFLVSCFISQVDQADAVATISLPAFEGHVKILSSDEFQGRKPFTEGEKKTLQYLQDQFKAMALQPGNGNSYLQEVPMVEITATTDSVMNLNGSRGKFILRGFHDFVLNTERTDSAVIWKDEEVVFAGFGIVAPEYKWNDYEGLDVKGKIVLVLVNDPGFGGTDTTFFKGNTMTYYGRWTYKYEEAARQGAKGCFVIHNTVPAGYPFGVLQNRWNNAHLYLDERGKSIPHCEGIGWITKPATEKLFTQAGIDFNTHQSDARKPGYKGMALNIKASINMSVTSHYDKSYNVVAKVEGTKRPDEYIIYTAHWDHLGIGKKDANGDSIYNGALDNASGTAGLLQLANAFSRLDPKPERSIVFLAVTAEEQGLWGAAFYAQNPIYPKEKTVANINMDGINPFGMMKDVMVVGKGQSDLEDYLREAASAVGRTVTPDSEPEKGSYFRSDHFWFARIGVPALYLKSGDHHVDKGPGYGKELKADYTAKYYHQPSDEFDTTRLNFEGGIEDLKLLFNVGRRLAFEETWPKWKDGSEFKSYRESYMK